MKKHYGQKKLEKSHASQILTNDCQILVLSYLSNYYCNSQLILPSMEPATAFMPPLFWFLVRPVIFFQMFLFEILTINSLIHTKKTAVGSMIDCGPDCVLYSLTLCFKDTYLNPIQPNIFFLLFCLLPSFKSLALNRS